MVHHLHGSFSSKCDDDIAERLAEEAGLAVRVVILPLALEQLHVALGHAAMLAQ